MKRSTSAILIVGLLTLPILFFTQNFGIPENLEESNRVEKQEIISISFKAIQQSLYPKFKAALDKELRTTDCDLVGTKKDDRPKDEQYKCNEIPYGDIENDGRKLLLDVKFEKQSGKQGGGEYKFDNGNFPLYMSRNQSYDKMSIDFLDAKSVVNMPVERRLSDNVFVEQTPLGGALNTRICMLLPGVRLFSEKQKIKGDIKKKLLFFSFHANVKMEVDLGEISFDAAKVCGTVKTDFKGGKVVIAVDKDSVDVKFAGVKKSGLKVDSDVKGGWLTEIIFKVADFFGSDIEGQIEKAINAKAKKIINGRIPKLDSKDFKSGRYLEEVVKFRYVQNLFNTVVDKSTDDGFIGLRDQLAGACLKVINGLNVSDNEKRDALLLCANVVKMDVKFFSPNPASAKKGCYKYGLRLAGPSGKFPWWGDDCAIDTVIQVAINQRFEPFYTCLFDKMRKGNIQENSCSQELSAALDDFRPSGLGRRINLILENANVFDNWEEAFSFANLLWDYKGAAPSYMKGYKPPRPLSRDIQIEPVITHGDRKLKVLTYNVQGLPAPIVNKPAWTFDEIGKQLNERLRKGTGPDVVMLQEVISADAERVVKAADYPYAFFGPPKRREGGVSVGLLGGDIILSRFPIVEAEYIEFGPKLCLGTDCSANKAWLIVRVRVPGVPHLVELVNVHMQSTPGLVDAYTKEDLVVVQKKQIDLLYKFYVDNGSYGRLPLIMAADFNFKPGLASYDYFKEMLKINDAGYVCTVKPATCTIERNTVPESLWKTNVDHHFSRSSNMVKVEPVAAEKNFKELVNGIPLSDHLGFEMDYRLTW